MKSIWGVLFTAAVVGAADKPSERIAPLIDDQTLVVVRVNVAAVEVKLLSDFVTSVAGESAGKDATKLAVDMQKALAAAGVAEIVVTYGASEFPNLPVLAFFGDGKIDGDQVTKLLRPVLGEEWTGAMVGNTYCFGTPDALKAARDRKPSARPELVSAIDGNADCVVALAFALSADARRVHEELSPNLPPELGGGDIKVFTRNLKWASVGLEKGEKGVIRWRIKGTGAKELDAMMAAWRRIEKVAQKTIPAELEETERALFKKAWSAYTATVTAKADGDLFEERGELKAVIEAIRVAGKDEGLIDRVQSTNNLKQIALAIHNYHDAYGKMPENTRDKQGNLLLSWRVQLLPFVEEAELFRKFRLDEAWDGPNNIKLLDRMPKVFQNPSTAKEAKTKTGYLGPASKDAFWDTPKGGLQLARIPDGTSNTIMLLEVDADRAVEWTKPADFIPDAKDPYQGLLGRYRRGFLAGLGDGSVRFIGSDNPADTIRALFTRSGGEVIPKLR